MDTLQQVQGKKAVVTGGAGFIGTHIVAALKERGFTVEVFDNKTGGNILDEQSLAKAFAGAEYVFHVAAMPRVPYSIEHPVETNEAPYGGDRLHLLQEKN